MCWGPRYLAKKGLDCDIELRLPGCVGYCIHCEGCNLGVDKIKSGGNTWREIENNYIELLNHIQAHKDNGDKVPWYVDDMVFFYHGREMAERGIYGPYGRMIDELLKAKNKEDIKQVLRENIGIYRKLMEGSAYEF